MRRPEWSFEIAWCALKEGPQHFSITGDDDVRRALAERFGIVTIEHLSAEGVLEPWRGDGARLSADLRARIVQNCVATLAPLEAEIETRVDIRYAQDALDTDPEALDAPEPLRGEALDIGEELAQHLSLEIDAYPRSADAPEIQHLEDAPATAAPDEDRVRPFAELNRLLARREE